MIRINAILPGDIIEKLDDIAKKGNKSRSMLLREMAKNFIEEYQHKLEEKQRREHRKHAIAIQDKLRNKAGKWDGVSEIRKWRETV